MAATPSMPHLVSPAETSAGSGTVCWIAPFASVRTRAFAAPVAPSDPSQNPPRRRAETPSMSSDAAVPPCVTTTSRSITAGVRDTSSRSRCAVE